MKSLPYYVLINGYEPLHDDLPANNIYSKQLYSEYVKRRFNL